jgi:NDP-sugar pyrophosphorylase family protein
MLAIILAAGRGKRLEPLTLSKSKAMQPILGKPMIERVMEGLKNKGIDTFIVVINPKDELLKHHLECRLSVPSKVKICFQDNPTGMAAALKTAAPFIEGDFVLSACDNLIPDEDMQTFISSWKPEKRLNGLLALMHVPDKLVCRSGIVQMRGSWITDIIEKPELSEAPSNIASIPLYRFSPRILEFINDIPSSPRGEHELQAAIQLLIDRYNKVQGIFISRRLTLSKPLDLLSINMEYLQKKHPLMNVLLSRSVGKDTQLIPPYYIENSAQIGNGCSIGPNVYIEHGCKIGANSKINNSVILTGAEVAERGNIVHQLVAPS